MIERAYKMTRLGPGDYLLPSNDGQTLWRLATYQEESAPDAWRIWRWYGSFPTLDQIAAALEADDWTRWEFWDGPFASRVASIESALRTA